MYPSSSSLAEPLNQHNNIESDPEPQHQQVELQPPSSSSSSLPPPTRLPRVPVRHHLPSPPPPALARSVIEALNEHDESGLTTLAILSPDEHNDFPTSLPPALNNYIDANTYRATIERCNKAFTVQIGGIINSSCSLIAFISCSIPQFVVGPDPRDLLSSKFIAIVSAVFVSSCAYMIYSSYKENRLQVSGLREVLELENVKYHARSRRNPLVWSIVTTPGPYLCDDPWSRKHQIRISSRVLKKPGQ